MRLRLKGISKFFAGVKALDGINFDLPPGEVHAICGENGAGKSTLMNILTGNLRPDEGEIILNGKNVQINGPAQAAQMGIAIVYQQLSLIDTLSVAENIFANTQPANRWGLIRYDLLRAETKKLLSDLSIDYIMPEQLVGDLSPGEKQMVEIAKALAKNPDILILDEPTASITARETETLFEIIRQLKGSGKSVIYISHRLAEIFRISDRVTVLKDGKYQGTRTTSNLQQDELIKLMVGRELVSKSIASSVSSNVLMEVRNLTGKAFSGINFSLHEGEILGMAGLIGAGRTEIAQTIFGYLPRLAGEVLLDGQPINALHPAEAIIEGIGYVPEERKSQGLFFNKSIVDNMMVTNLQAAANPTWYDEDKAHEFAQVYREKLRIVTPDVQTMVANLSGGNQQKVVLAKWLLTNPRVLIIDEPTHGIDVGAKAEIYEMLRELTKTGKGILLISSELPELLAISDRILVIREGRITGFLNARDTNEEEIMALASLVEN